MYTESISLQENGSKEYAHLSVYIQEYTQEIGVEKRPMIIICPGGAYGWTSDREAEPIALKFLAAGFHAAVLRYSVAPAVYPTALTELGRSMQIIRENGEKWHVDTDKIVVFGCSAGGHLAADYACEWHEDFLADYLQVSKDVLRPNGLMLAYPVITSGEFAHAGSIQNLLGDQYEEKKDDLSLEKRVNEFVPKTFIWSTWTDGSVPVENSLLFAGALKKADINTELHIFNVGGHGLALANELTVGRNGKEVVPQVQPWIDLAITWMENL